MDVYRTRKICINKQHALYQWCSTVTSLGNNLSNAVRFRQRQILTAVRKDSSSLTENEKQVIAEFKAIHKTFDAGNSFISKSSMEKTLRANRNPDFFAKGLPRQTAQHIVYQACDDMENYYRALAAYKASASGFTGMPELPGYKKKGGMCTVEISNQDCTIAVDEHGRTYAGLPFAKSTPLCLGESIGGTLKKVTVTPTNGVFVLGFTFDVQKPDVMMAAVPERIAGIDFGVNNLMAVTNNCGLPCLLYKGGIVKSINQKYNKELAAIMQKEMAKPGCPKNKNGAPKFVPTRESMELTNRRNNRIHDFMLKAACHFVAWCVENRIDTVVAGVNSDWKQNPDMNHVNNQNFVQIPFALLRSIISYKCEEFGIHFIEHEESYTSQASFIDNDYIPTYNVDPENASFSGLRGPTRYKGMYRKSGFHGIYRTKDGIFINADLNGSANIIRKTIPDAFSGKPTVDFSRVVIIKNPDQEFILLNQAMQQSKRSCVISHAKAIRILKRLAA